MQPSITITLKLDEQIEASISAEDGGELLKLVDNRARYAATVRFTAAQFDRLAAFVASARAHPGRGEYGDKGEEA